MSDQARYEQSRMRAAARKLTAYMILTAGVIGTSPLALAGLSSTEVARVRQMLIDWENMEQYKGYIGPSDTDPWLAAHNDYIKLCAMGDGQPRIGMTATEAIATSWCMPDSIHSTETAAGKTEEWSYTNRYRHDANLGLRYLYFAKGRLVAITR